MSIHLVIKHDFTASFSLELSGILQILTTSPPPTLSLPPPSFLSLSVYALSLPSIVFNLDITMLEPFFIHFLWEHFILAVFLKVWSMNYPKQKYLRYLMHKGRLPCSTLYNQNPNLWEHGSRFVSVPCRDVIPMQRCDLDIIFNMDELFQKASDFQMRSSPNRHSFNQ